MIIQYSESNKSTIIVTDLKYISTNKGVKNVTVTYKKYGKLPIIVLLNTITLNLNEMTSFIMREMQPMSENKIQYYYKTQTG